MEPIWNLMLKVLIPPTLKFVFEASVPWWLSCKESACNAGDTGSIPGSGRSPGGGNGNPLQYSCLENPMDREAWLAAVHGVTRDKHNLATEAPPPLIEKLLQSAL